MSEIKIKETDLLLGSDIAGSVTELSGRKQEEIDISLQKRPDKKLRTKSFWVAKTCERFVVIKTVDRSDGKEPHISGLTFMPDGHLIACDKNNSSIKLFTEDFVMKYELYVGDKPFDVAVVDQSGVIVSFPDKGILQFVILKPGVKLGRKIPTNGTCLGLTVRKSQMYVCIHEIGQTVREAKGKQKIIKERFCGIKVFSLDGKLQFSILHNGYGYPKLICVKEDGRKIYYTGGAGQEAFIACVNKDGSGVFRFSDEMLQFPAGIALDKSENLIVGDLQTGYLHLIEPISEKRKYLPDGEDKRTLSSIAYNPHKGMLVIGRFSTLNAYYILKPNKSEKENSEINNVTFEHEETKQDKACCVLL